MKRTLPMALVALALAAGCNGILGIEEAEVDPNFARPGAGASPCAEYCAAVTTNCTDANKQYFDLDTCLEMCPAIPRGGAEFNTLECRLNAAKAAVGNKPVECLSAGAFGEGKCSGRENPKQCEVFCGLTLRLCGANGFADLSSCATACGGLRYENGGRLFRADGPIDQSKDTLDCRMTHLMIAHAVKNDAEYRKLHCEHTRVPSTACKP